jgi:DNA recombination protein RmuC
MTLLIILVILLVVIAAAAVVALLRSRGQVAKNAELAREAEHAKQLVEQQLHTAEQALVDADARHQAELTRRSEEFAERMAASAAEAKKQLDDRLADAERLRQSQAEAMQRQIAEERAVLGDRFKAMAAEILQSNSQQLDERSKLSLEAVLAPMKTSLETFTNDFKACYSVEHNDRLSLREGIQSLVELNREVSAETRRLTHALKGDTRAQGQWGEIVLRNILEHSGLEQGREYVLQDSTTDENGAVLRPDAVINCPKDRKIIIDSKVSLTAYLKWLNSDDDAERDEAMKAHITSVENHIRELKSKSYQDRIGARNVDFVLMFLPHEGAYIAAMTNKEDLWRQAYDGRVVIVSPTHLVTVIKLVEQMWQTEDQNVNSLRIAEEAVKMMDKLTDFLNEFVKVGDNIQRSLDSYSSSLKKMKEGNGNVFRRIENLRTLGIKGKKELSKRLITDAAEAVDDSDDDTPLDTPKSLPENS